MHGRGSELLVPLLAEENQEPHLGVACESNGQKFGRRHWGTIFEKRAAVRQKRAMEDYVQEFEVLVA